MILGNAGLLQQDDIHFLALPIFCLRSINSDNLLKRGIHTGQVGGIHLGGMRGRYIFGGDFMRFAHLEGQKKVCRGVRRDGGGAK